jgi:hypothetical protein
MKGLWRFGDREDPQNRPGVGLSGAGSRLIVAPLDGWPTGFLRAGQRVPVTKLQSEACYRLEPNEPVCVSSNPTYLNNRGHV